MFEKGHFVQMTSIPPPAPSERGDPPIQIRVHQLEIGQNLETTLYRVQKGWVIHFKMGPSLLGKRIHLFTNHPLPGALFIRSSYRELNWQAEGSNKSDHTGLYAELLFTLAGSFRYFFSLDGSDEVIGEGYFVVDPVLTVGPTDEEVLPLDCIQCQTYISKSLGPLDEWESRLAVAREAGYNMIHLTPLQHLGLSNSSYSLQDQHKLNPNFSRPGQEKPYTMDDVHKLTRKLKSEWKMATLTDVVLNHTSNESIWLQEHPECAYNLENSPHLRPAYLLDRAIFLCSLDLVADKWLPQASADILNEDDLQKIGHLLHSQYFTKIKLPQFYMVNVDQIVNHFVSLLKGEATANDERGDKILKDSQDEFDNKDKKIIQDEIGDNLKIIQDPQFRRLKSTVNMKLALKLYAKPRSPEESEDAWIQDCCQKLRSKLEDLNREAEKEINIHLGAAVNNVLAGCRYERLQADGPKYGRLSRRHPLSRRYFHRKAADLTLEEEEKLMMGPKSKYIMAHNGWVMGDDPLRDFAKPGSNVYIRRELIAWGDSVKLRYGDGPQDCPYLYGHMARYVEEMAHICDGLRLDNCHSTPIHAAEYLIDKARMIRPELYVIAELFTSSSAIDNIFVNRLGINSLIREGMAAHNSYDLGRHVYLYGGQPVGAFLQPIVRPLTPSIAHAIFLDQTHDNPSPVEKRSVYDLLPSAALISMACCATGSTRGYDELVPHHIHVVNETRLYSSWPEQVCEKTGIIFAKKALNQLHYELGIMGFTQVYVDQVDENVVAVTRHCPLTHQSVILVARTAFTPPPANLKDSGSYFIPPLCIPGMVEEIILEARLRPKTPSSSTTPWSKSTEYINGLTGYTLDLRQHIKLFESEMVEFNTDKYINEVEFTSFPPGSVVAFRVSLSGESRAAISKLRACIAQFGYRIRRPSISTLQQLASQDFHSLVQNLSLSDFNHVLFRCEPEEREDEGGGPYHIPGWGNLVYCGLQGMMSLLGTIHLRQDLGHPFCEHLRQGDWLMDYTVKRLKSRQTTEELSKWFANTFHYLKMLPRYLIPCYFDSVITGAYSSLLSSIWGKMDSFIEDGSTFARALALGSVALMGHVKSSPLPEVAPGISNTATLSAGLPHFSTGYARNWGRDTFISLRGLCLITGRHQEAKNIILAFAGCLRHGLIPNLLDKGTNARYNCRDAVWWWLQSIQDYCTMTSEGTAILSELVSRLYPNDDSPPQPVGAHVQPLHDIMQEALQRHYAGISFRERNAGHQIDSQMTNEGFNVEVGVSPETGFVYGGNQYNCGTWMDKMGSSQKAGNKGQPATPRDGSAVELVGLCKSTLRWLSKLHQAGLYPFSGVDSNDGKKVSFEAWDQLIQANFEKYFWIPPSEISEVEKSPHLIHRRGIYKDCLGSTKSWQDYQLRPNFCITMAIAPELFTPDKAWKALSMQEELLLGPLGMKTLDPGDWNYRGNYVNSDDSTDPQVAQGFNYHQGPEWLWPVGFFLRAKLHFSRLISPRREDETLLFVTSVLSRHFHHIQDSPWRGLPELTNANGANCPDGCPIQAWSHATLLEVLYDLSKL